MRISLSALPLSLARKFVKGWDKNRYADIFNKYGSGKGIKSRIYIPIGDAKPAVDSKIPYHIAQFLDSKGMAIDSYAMGTVFMPDGKRIIRMGKALADQPELLKLFASDPQRQGMKTDANLCVISRHPYDIAGMSFDRGWTSCMNLYKGENRSHVKDDIKAGTLVAYLVKNKDKNINNPTARILLKPFRRKGVTILVPDQTYGHANPTFREVVRRFCEWTNSGSPEGVYFLDRTLYDDGRDKVYHTLSDNFAIPDNREDLQILLASGLLSEEQLINAVSRMHQGHLKAALDSYRLPENVLRAISNHPKLNHENKIQLARDHYTPLDVLDRLIGMSTEVDLAVASNSFTSAALLTKLARSTHIEVLEAVLAHSKATQEALSIIYKNHPGEFDSDIATLVSDEETIRTMYNNNKAQKTPASKKMILALAQNEALPADIISELGAIEYLWTELNNLPNLPEDLAFKMAKKGSANLRWTLAGRTRNMNVLLQLAKSEENNGVAESIIENEASPLAALTYMRDNYTSLPKDKMRKLRARIAELELGL